MQHRNIARALSVIALACTAGVVGLAPAQPEPEPKKKIVLRLKTDEGVVIAQIVTDEQVRDLSISDVELIDLEGQFTGTLVVDQAGQLSVVSVPKILPPIRLGLTTEVVPESLAFHLNMQPAEGLLVTDLVEGLPASKGGLIRYDVLVELDGETPVTQQVLRSRVQSCKPGDPLKFSIVRHGEPLEFVIVAEEQIAEGVQLPAWTIDATRRYITNQPLRGFEYAGTGVATPVEPATAQYLWTLDEDGSGTAQYKVIGSESLPADFATNIISTPQADGALLLSVSPTVSMRRSTLSLQNTLPLESGRELDMTKVQVALADSSDPIGNLRAQIAAMKQQLATLEALVDQLEVPKD